MVKYAFNAALRRANENSDCTTTSAARVPDC